MNGLVCAFCEWFYARLRCQKCGRLLCSDCWLEGAGCCPEDCDA